MMSNFLPIRHSSCSCAAGAIHSPSNNMVQPLQCLFLQAAHVPTGFADTQQQDILLHRCFCTCTLESQSTCTHCRCLHVYAPHGGIIYATPQLHPINIQPHKCHTAASVLTSAPLAVRWRLLYAACEKPPGESILENCLLQGRLGIFKDPANQLSRPFIAVNTKVFYLFHPVCGASSR